MQHGGRDFYSLSMSGKRAYSCVCPNYTIKVIAMWRLQRPRFGSGAELSPGNIRLRSFHAMARVSNSNRLLEIFDCTGISCVSSIEKQYMEGHVSPLLSQSARLQRKFPQKLAQKENEA